MSWVPETLPQAKNENKKKVSLAVAEYWEYRPFKFFCCKNYWGSSF